MSSARVGSIDALKRFRAQLFKFAEAASVALGDAESEIHRTLSWLDNEQLTRWQSEERKRTAIVARCAEALRMKKLFTGPAGSKQSSVDEEKALQVAKRRLEESREKIIAVKTHSRKLQKEMLLYKGQVQRFSTSAAVDIPLAAALLGNMIVRLEAYATLAPALATSTASAGSTAGSMSRAPDEASPAMMADAFNTLRTNTPTPQQRAAADAGSTDLIAAKEQISDPDRGVLVGLISSTPLDEQLKLTLSASIAGKTRIYMERLEPAATGDSGWFIGPAEPGDQPVVKSLTLAECLATRPDWRELFSLPVGTLIILDGPTIAAILDTKGDDLWSSASIAKLMQSADPDDAPAPAGPVVETPAVAEGSVST